MIVSVLQKSQQIGILKSMGAKQAQILRIFVFEGLGVAIFGSGLGAILGTAIVFLLGLLTRASTQIGRPPDRLFPVQILPKYIAAAILELMWFQSKGKRKLRAFLYSARDERAPRTSVPIL